MAKKLIDEVTFSTAHASFLSCFDSGSYRQFYGTSSAVLSTTGARRQDLKRQFLAFTWTSWSSKRLQICVASWDLPLLHPRKKQITLKVLKKRDLLCLTLKFYFVSKRDKVKFLQRHCFYVDIFIYAKISISAIRPCFFSHELLSLMAEAFLYVQTFYSN